MIVIVIENPVLADIIPVNRRRATPNSRLSQHYGFSPVVIARSYLSEIESDTGCFRSHTQ